MFSDMTPITTVTQTTGSAPEIWDFHRPTIKRLYLDEDKTLPEVMKIMEHDFHFKASRRMYTKRLKLWEIDGKNLRRSDVKAIARAKVARAAVGKPSMFRIKGRLVDMANVERYVKKHGYASIALLIEASSPFAQNEDVMCYTPGHSPHIFEPFSAGPPFDTVQAGQENFFRDLEWMAPPHGESPVEHDADDISQCQVTSPEERLRRLLSLSPAPRSPTQPTMLRIPEETLWNVKAYLQGNLDSGSWFSDSNGFIDTVGTLTGITKFIGSNCSLAVQMIQLGKFVQGRQLLSKACVSIEGGIRENDPQLLPNLLRMRHIFEQKGMHEVFVTAMKHSSHSARLLIGYEHPLAQALQALAEFHDCNKEIYSQLSLCIINVLEGKFGSLHREVLEIRRMSLRFFDPHQVVAQSRTLLAICDTQCSPLDLRRLGTAYMLGSALYDVQQNAEAEAVLLNIVDTLETVAHLIGYRQTYLRVLFTLVDILIAKGEFKRAQHYSRLCVDESMKIWGWDAPVTIHYVGAHIDLLRDLGRDEEADELEDWIQDYLGPPEIEELLQ